MLHNVTAREHHRNQKIKIQKVGHHSFSTELLYIPFYMHVQKHYLQPFTGTSQQTDSELSWNWVPTNEQNEPSEEV